VLTIQISLRSINHVDGARVLRLLGTTSVCLRRPSTRTAQEIENNEHTDPSQALRPPEPKGANVHQTLDPVCLRACGEGIHESALSVYVDCWAGEGGGGELWEERMWR
jgi:hypothetical protein